MTDKPQLGKRLMKILRLKSVIKRRSSQLLQLKIFLQNDFSLNKSSPIFVGFFVSRHLGWLSVILVFKELKNEKSTIATFSTYDIYQLWR